MLALDDRAFDKGCSLEVGSRDYPIVKWSPGVADPNIHFIASISVLSQPRSRRNAIVSQSSLVRAKANNKMQIEKRASVPEKILYTSRDTASFMAPFDLPATDYTNTPQRRLAVIYFRYL